ncbi:MAG: undecaprenyl-diphosphate phosphatase [bacterium]|nr:undecaprenyl-diphosphate phosphatase [bacterium]
MIHSIILGIVQGITEFFPVSSSAHLAFLEQLFGITDKLQFTVFLHFGSVIAIIFILWKDIWDILLHDRRTILLLIIGSIPAVIVGVGFESKIEKIFNEPFMIAVALIITGLVLWFTRLKKAENNNRTKISVIDAILIGIAQSLAIVPGLSRSGFTISTGIYMGLDRTAATKFSLLLGCIAILGASLLEFIDILKLGSSALQTMDFGVISVGVLISFLVSYMAIKLLFKVVRKQSFSLFAIYCWVVGIFVLLKM